MNDPSERRWPGANNDTTSRGERYPEIQTQDPAPLQSGEIAMILGVILSCLVPGGVEICVSLKRATNRPTNPSANPVSWQTVFWGLTAIALNTMCQPSGEVLGLPVQYNFVLRASPLVCLVNSLDVIVLYAHFFRETKGLITAAQRLVSHRAKDTEDWDENSFAALCNNTCFRVILFVLGALPQIIKICAFRGVPMSQFYMVCFLSSYVLDEVVLFVGRGEEPRRPARRRETPDEGLHGIAGGVQKALRYTTLGYSVFIMLSNITFAVDELTPQVYSRDKTWPFTVCIGILGAAYLCSTFILPDPRLLCQLGLYTGAVSLSSTIVMTLPVIVTMMWSTAAEHRLEPSLLVGLFCGTGIGVLWLLVYFQIVRRYDRYRSAIDLGRASSFFLLHLLGALLGYCFVYDPTCTYKPAWVDRLG